MLRYDLEPPVARLVIDDADRHNPLSTEVMSGLRRGVERAAADSDVRVIVLTGAGERTFSAGGDLAGGFVDSPIALHGPRGELAHLFRALRTCGKPTLARVNGHALGGGFGLVVGCDIAIAADHATFGTPEIKVGLWPMMITVVLQRYLPPKAALELMMTGRRIGAEEALRLGAISRVVPAADLDGAVDETVAALVTQSPAVLAIGRSSFYAAENMGFDAALEHLQIGLTVVASTEDAAEGIAAFLEKRPPAWRGR